MTSKAERISKEPVGFGNWPIDRGVDSNVKYTSAAYNAITEEKQHSARLIFAVEGSQRQASRTIAMLSGRILNSPIRPIKYVARNATAHSKAIPRIIRLAIRTRLRGVACVCSNWLRL